MLSLPQPWASLLARGAVRFAVCADTTRYRGTVAIHASSDIDPEPLERLETDAEFIALMAARGFNTASDFDALPRDAIVGIGVIADVWTMETLEEVATEDDAILIGDVVETAVFWELAEVVEFDAIDAAAAPFEPLPDALTSAAQDAARSAGAQFDADGLVFWPVVPSASLAALIGDDAIGDREITRRVWAHVAEHDLQDPEDHAYVYLDDALRSALETDADGMPTIEFLACINAQLRE